MMNNAFISNLIARLKEEFTKGMSTSNPLAIVGKALEILKSYGSFSNEEKATFITQALTKIAAGADGVYGTADDVIPPQVIDAVKVLIEKQLISDIVHLVLDAVRGKFDVAEAGEVVTDAAAVCVTCFGGSKKKKAAVVA